MERQRAAIYARSATFQEPGSNFVMADQIHQCREFAASKGYVVVAEFQEVGSGANLARAVLREVLVKARSHEFDVLVVLDFLRLSRRQEQLESLLTEFEKAQVKIDCCRASYIGSTTLITNYGDALKKRRA